MTIVYDILPDILYHIGNYFTSPINIKINTIMQKKKKKL